MLEGVGGVDALNLEVCNVTKVTALMAHEYHANKVNPNLNKLRRQVRKLRSSAADFQAHVHPLIWKWCSDAEGFWAVAVVALARALAACQPAPRFGGK